MVLPLDELRWMPYRMFPVAVLSEMVLLPLEDESQMPYWWLPVAVLPETVLLLDSPT